MFQKNISESKPFEDKIQFINGNVNDGEFSFVVDDILRKEMIKNINSNSTLHECANLAVKLFNSRENYILMSVKESNQENIKRIEKTNIKIEKAW